MAVVEMNGAVLSEAPAGADAFYELGMMYSTGREVPVDMVSAHKWFNIAAMRGHKDATTLRREIAAQMSDKEIGLAQRAARDWLKANPEAPAVEKPMEVRAAA
ncbi:MAG: SEL1-like repeat protein [Hyphomicrobiales bacterium]